MSVWFWLSSSSPFSLQPYSEQFREFVNVQVRTDLECTHAMDVCAHLLCLTCHTSCGLTFFHLSSVRKLGRQGEFLCQLLLLFVLFSTIKKGETFSQMYIVEVCDKVKKWGWNRKFCDALDAVYLDTVRNNVESESLSLQLCEPILRS